MLSLLSHVTSVGRPNVPAPPTGKRLSSRSPRSRNRSRKSIASGFRPRTIWTMPCRFKLTTVFQPSSFIQTVSASALCVSGHHAEHQHVENDECASHVPLLRSEEYILGTPFRLY